MVAGATDASNGGMDLWMLKLDHAGDIIWQNIYHYNGQSGLESVQETSDGGFVVANSTTVPGHKGSRAGVLKLDKNGEVVWQKAYGEHDLIPRSIQETSDAGFILAGNITYTAQSSSTQYWVLKLDSSGSVVWQYAYDSGLKVVHSVVVSETGGGYIVAGQIDNYTDEGKEVRLLKLDTMGNIIWQKSYGGGFGLSGFSDLLVTPDDMIIVAGFIADWRDNNEVGRIIKLDSGGNVIWQKVGDGLPVFEGAGDIEETSDGGFVIAGSIDTGGQKDADFLVLKLDRNGNVPGCPITWNAPSAIQNEPLIPENISFTRHTLGRESIDTDVIVNKTYIEPIDTHIVPRDQCSTSYPVYLISSDFDILAYSLETFRYDADECAEALVSIDGEIVKVLDKLCGRDQQTGWLTASFHQFLSEGTHTLTVSAYNNKKTGLKEKADVYFDEISIVINDPHLEETQCADSIDNDSDDFTDCYDSDCSGSIECPSDPYLVEDFDNSHDVLEYQDDLFYDTHNAPYANGLWVEEGRSSSKGLQLTLGNVDNEHILDGISGVWQGHFGIIDPTEVTVSIDYRLVMTRFDADECAQVLVQVDNGPVETAAELCGRGKDTGWQTHTFVQSLSSADHSLSIGGHVNKKTGQREKADIYFDNVEVR